MLKLSKGLDTDFQVSNRKPVGDLEIDWSNPLTRHLSHFFMIGNGKYTDLVKQKPANQTVVSTAPTTTPYSIVTSGSSGSYIDIDITPLDIDNFTVVTGCNRFSGSALISILDRVSAQWSGFYAATGRAGRMVAANVFDGAVNPVAGGVPREKGLFYSAYTVKGTEFKGSCQGGAISTDSSFTTPSGTFGKMALGASVRSIVDNEAVGEIMFVAIYSTYSMPEDDLKRVSAAPYKLLKPKRDMYYFTPEIEGFKPQWAIHANKLINMVQ